MKELLIIFAVIFVIVTVFAIVLIKQDKKKNRSLTNLFLSYDKPKQVRIKRLKNDLMENDVSMRESEALELAIKLEKSGWRKEVEIYGMEVYL